MKALKISLAALVLAAIGVFVWLAIKPAKCDKCGKPLKECVCLVDIDSDNPFVKGIEQKINDLQNKPNENFCKKDYDEIKFDIADKYKKLQLGSGTEGDKWNKSLAQNLFRAYSAKFIEQAFYVFRHNEWKMEDLNFIATETAHLQKEPNHTADDAFEPKFKELQQIRNKYNEIVSFISSCKSFGYSGTALSNRFPIADVQSKISRATSLRNNHLENEYVNHCTRLHDGLKEIPQALFRAHVRYLDRKINDWSDMYPNYPNQKSYADLLYTPLRSEIDVLDNNTYNVSNFDGEYNRLSKKWSDDNKKAYNYPYPKP
jgi:hypothetical protein